MTSAGDFPYLILIQEHLELLHTYAKVRLIVLIGNVPAQGTKLTSLLDHSVEEA